MSTIFDLSSFFNVKDYVPSFSVTSNILFVRSNSDGNVLWIMSACFSIGASCLASFSMNRSLSSSILTSLYSFTASLITPPKITASVLSPTPQTYTLIPSYFTDINIRVFKDWGAMEWTDVNLLIGVADANPPFIRLHRHIPFPQPDVHYRDLVFRRELPYYAPLILGVREYIVGLLFENRKTGAWYWVHLQHYTTY